MGRISVDYDLMYQLARDIWALRDKLLDTSRAHHGFTPSDIGPREETAGALTYFYGAWTNSFEDAWQVMTDLGNLLDEMGKAFYDQDAQGAVSSRQQEAAMVRQEAGRENQANEQKKDARLVQAKAEDLRQRYAARQATVDKQQAELDRKRAALDDEQQVLNKRQEDLNKRYDERQKTPDADAGDLRREQEGLWKDQDRLDEAQDRLDKEGEPLRERSEGFLKDYTDELDELRKTPPESLGDDTGWLRGHRELADDPDTPPAPVPDALVRETADGRTEVSYKLDENGEIELDKNGNPLETTTTVTNKNGLTYSETNRSLAGHGDSVTTIRASDGSVTKIYVDNNPEGYGPGESIRYITDEKGAALQTWRKTPGGEWGMVWDRNSDPSGEEEAEEGVGRPPAYLTVEKPLVNGAGRPLDGYSPGAKTIELSGGATRTDYTRPDGSGLTVVTTDTVRYVADGSNEIQEVWYRSRAGGWYLKDSASQLIRYGDEPPLGTLGDGWR